jgi:hypothetical protein
MKSKRLGVGILRSIAPFVYNSRSLRVLISMVRPRVESASILAAISSSGRMVGAIAGTIGLRCMVWLLCPIVGMCLSSTFRRAFVWSSGLLLSSWALRACSQEL